jgi:peptide-methionine (R)-S-oxide reductase
MVEKIKKSPEEWMKQLNQEQFQICRMKGTEPPFTGKYNQSKKQGSYLCVCCGQELFSSEAKFDSGTGWPSFFDAVNGECVETEVDSSLGVVRSEILCSRCDSHLGHVFDDGPQPTGLRYCVNSASMILNPTDKD